ncbi:MAG TPA: hypothetical protein VIN70_00970 [Candidatus Limnocylindria bacterium]|jgi:hypothetical protein
MPTWLPSSLDRDHLVTGETRTDAADPHYLVTYRGSGRSIDFGMGGAGPGQTSGQSGVGTRVRRSSAVLSFPPSLFSDPAGPALRIIRWQEGGHDLWVSSSTFSGGDLLRVAWELDLGSAPPPVHAYQRPSIGNFTESGCASLAGPRDTVDHLLPLIGAHTRTAILDCFAADQIDAFGEDAILQWSELPATSDQLATAFSEVGGRVEVEGTWTFASDPGGAWNQRQTMFFLMGREDGRWRVFGAGTAPFGRPP